MMCAQPCAWLAIPNSSDDEDAIGPKPHWSCAVIIVDAQSGLANRMQAIDSGHSRASDLGRLLCVPWNVNEACDARVDKLFESFKVSIEIEHFCWDDKVEAFLSSHKSALVINHNVSPYMDIQNVEMSLILGNVRQLQARDVIILRTWARFYRSPGHSKSSNRWLNTRGRIDAVRRQFGERTVGVHVRRTDHLDSVAESPTSAFKALMASLLTGGETATFFLSTDNSAEEECIWSSSARSSI
jgi:hypothetical protein